MPERRNDRIEDIAQRAHVLNNWVEGEMDKRPSAAQVGAAGLVRRTQEAAGPRLTVPEQLVRLDLALRGLLVASTTDREALHGYAALIDAAAERVFHLQLRTQEGGAALQERLAQLTGSLGR